MHFYFREECKKTLAITNTFFLAASSFVEICGKGNNNITIQLDGASSDMFIISPNFPLNYPSGQTCQLNLQINGSLELHLLYMDLQHRTTGGTTDLGCYDYVRIWEYDNRAPSIGGALSHNLLCIILYTFYTFLYIDVYVHSCCLACRVLRPILFTLF